jgi:hypothetical protein
MQHGNYLRVFERVRVAANHWAIKISVLENDIKISGAMEPMSLGEKVGALPQSIHYPASLFYSRQK